MDFWRYGSEILLRTSEHLLVVALSVAIALLIGIPGGVLISRRPRLAVPILGFANAIQTIPSLAIFGFLISVPFLGGIGKNPAIVALSLYALLPLIRNTYTGIAGVDRAIVEAGRGMGMTSWQLLRRVELPLAAPTILAGVRIATVTSVGIATIAAAIGAGGLGTFIFRGISTVNNTLILLGALPAAAMALLADFVIGCIERSLAPDARNPGKVVRRSVAGLLLVLLASGAVVVRPFAPSERPTSGNLTVGSKNFTEQRILGELLAQHIEATTDLSVARQLNLGGTFICHEAVKAGQIDGYVEYTGTALTGILQQDVADSAAAIYNRVKAAYAEQFDLDVLPPLGFENTYALVVRSEDARRHDLRDISDLRAFRDRWQAGFGYEFVSRPDGYEGLIDTYDFRFQRPPDIMDWGLTFRALAKHQVDVISVNSTDGLIQRLGLVVLDDDRDHFPPYEAIPVFHGDTLDRYPQVRAAIADLGGRITAADMQAMNYAVDVEFRSVAEVVREFRESANL